MKKHVLKRPRPWSRPFLVGTIVLVVAAVAGAFAGPASAQTAAFDVCKAAGSGITLGTSFTFTVNGQTLVVPAGECVRAGEFDVGSNVTVQETVPTGVQVSSITVGDSATLVSANLATGTAVVGIGAFHNTVTFTNELIPTAALDVCKVAGTGIVAGTNFTFTVNGQTLVVPAGECVRAGEFDVGSNVTVQETIPSGVQVSSITVGDAATLVSANLATGTAVVGIGAFHNTVTFTNELIPTAALDVCKVAGSGIVAGTNFTFTVNGQTLVVPAGQCVAAGQFPVGSNVTVQETIPSGVQVSSITVGDSATLVSANLATGTAVVGIGPFHNTVTFTNQLIPAPAICTVTKGFYRNHPEVVAEIVAGLGGTLTVGGTALTTAQVQAILDATPGQPGNVTFTSNLLLNTTQQLITALLNLGGNVAAGPAAVQAAIAAAQAGIQITIGGGGQIQIATTLTQGQLSSLTATLTSFNEGQFPGFAACPED